MRTFLGVLMVLIVSGDTRTIRGVLNGSVLLPCDCSGRNLNKEFKWQTNKSELVLKCNSNNCTQKPKSRYEGRARTFVEEDSNNCSILLTDITADDQAAYTCIFHTDIYETSICNLDVSAIYSVCQKNNSSSVFQCEVQGCCKDADIQWKLDDQLLTNSTTIQINNSPPLETPPGIFLFKSELISKLNMTLVPTCSINATRISTITTYECGGVAGAFSIQTDPRRDCSMRYLKIIPVVLALGLSLVLWSYWKSSHGVHKTRQVKTIDERPEGEAMMSNGG